MKLLLLAALLPFSAHASLPVLNCHNGATGAEVTVGYYADHSYMLMNSTLKDVLERQGARDLDATGGDGAVIRHEGHNVTFTSMLRDGGTLTIAREDGGYRLRVVQPKVEANFYFNNGDCRD